MEVLIRKSGTSLYWNAAGRWTPSREQASDLREVCRAVLLCLRRGWKDAELVIRFEEMAGEMTVPVASIPPPRTLKQRIHTRFPRAERGCGPPLHRRLLRWAAILPFRRKKRVSFGCRRNIGPGGYGTR